jgi:hypothetical protein
MYGDATKKRLLLTSSVLSSNVIVNLAVQRYHQDSGLNISKVIYMLVVDVFVSIRYILEGTKYVWIGMVFMVN